MKAPNLSPNDEHLIKVTLTQTLDHSFVKEKLKRTFSDSRHAVAQNNEDFITTEDAYLTSDLNQISLSSLLLLNDNHLDMQYNDPFNCPDDNNFEFDTFYIKNRPRQPFKSNKSQLRQPLPPFAKIMQSFILMQNN